MRLAATRSLRPWGIAGLLLGLWAPMAWGHAYPARFEPKAGAVLRTTPTLVRIWFEGDLEPAFSTIAVTDAAGQRVDRGDARVDPQNRRLLRVSLRPLPPGVYRVAWNILAIDGHRTRGDYPFTVKAPE